MLLGAITDVLGDLQGFTDVSRAAMDVLRGFTDVLREFTDVSEVEIRMFLGDLWLFAPIWHKSC